MAGIKWERALDVKKAVANVRSEFVGDWHLDPWGWPELEFIASSAPELLVEHLKSTGVFRAALVDVPKENWGVRPAVVLNILDRLIYQGGMKIPTRTHPDEPAAAAVFANGNESNTGARLSRMACKRITLEDNDFEG